MSMEVANEPPYLYIVEEKMQVVAEEDCEIPEDELPLREREDEIPDQDCEERKKY